MIAPICIPLSSCNQAADLLIQWFTPEELHTFIGGERWWQVRGLDGVDAEWIADRSQVAAGKKLPPSKASRRDKSKAGKCIHDMQQLDTVMVRSFTISLNALLKRFSFMSTAVGFNFASITEFLFVTITRWIFLGINQ